MPQTPEQMAETMRANVPEKTGKTFDQWFALLSKAQLAKHGEIVKHLKSEHGVTHGFANLIAHDFLNAGKDDSAGDLVAAQYSGKKEGLRPVYDAIMTKVSALGKDIEIAPKKAYVSLRRNKQFATVGPATNSEVEVGINLKGASPTARLKEAKGGMVSHAVRLSDAKEVDGELIDWLKQAYDAA